MGIFQILGWTATSLFLLAYFLVSYNKISANSRCYQWMNFAGAIFMGISVFHNRAWPAVALELAWGTIALGALLKIYRQKNE